MKIIIGKTPVDVQLLNNDGSKIEGVMVRSLKIELNAQQVPLGHFTLEFWGENEIRVDGLSIDKEGLIWGEQRGVVE